ncbi:MAG TPA: NAD-dependent epimerase/dehydratase family protein [Rhizomicrobium sp.]|nr:NAD-dependent epimerase/dehydratase family protein [Rhizomicrobium sp.]
MSNTVLVTGGTGFIGAAVTAALRESGRSVIALGRADGDITSPKTLDRHRGKSVTSVVHCAGRTFVPDSWEYPASFLETNAGGTMRVLEFCRGEGARLVHIGAYIYGRPESLPIAESAPVRANNPYAFSKHVAEEACRFHAEHMGLEVTVLRPFNVYGPGQPEKFLIPTILAQLRHGHSVEMLDLEPRRDYVFLADLVDAVLRAEARAERGYSVFNIGSGISHSVAEIVATAQAVAGTHLKVTSRQQRRAQEIPDVVADITAAKTILNWTPRHNLSAGLEKCWNVLRPAPVEQTI